MHDPQRENARRWRAWRSACESGRDWAEAYDHYLHPATRVELEGLDAESPAEEDLHAASAR